MIDAATSAPFLEIVVHPVIRMQISSVGIGNIHTIEAQALPIFEDLAPGLIHVTTLEL